MGPGALRTHRGGVEGIMFLQIQRQHIPTFCLSNFENTVLRARPETGLYLLMHLVAGQRVACPAEYRKLRSATSPSVASFRRLQCLFVYLCPHRGRRMRARVRFAGAAVFGGQFSISPETRVGDPCKLTTTALAKQFTHKQSVKSGQRVWPKGF
jgi:hypothetical protein